MTLLKTLLPLSILFQLVACTSAPVRPISVEPPEVSLLTIDEIQKEGLVSAGLIQYEAKHAPKKSQLDYILYVGLKQKYPQTTIIPLKPIEHEMSPHIKTLIFSSQYHPWNIYTDYQINQSTQYSRFIASYLILEDDIQYDESRDSDKKCFETDRTTKLAFTIKDFSTKKVVWFDQQEVKIGNYNCNPQAKASGDSFGERLVSIFATSITNSVFDGIFGTYPKPAKIESMVVRGLARMVYKLPGS